jgi:cytochrome P450
VALLTLPPGPRPRLSLGVLLAMRREPLNFLEDLFRRYGDVVGMQLRQRPVCFLFNPEHINEMMTRHTRKMRKGPALQRSKRLLGEGLLTSEGELHTRQRRIIQPLFQPTRIASYAPQMLACVPAVMDRWRDGETIDVHAAMMELALRVALRTLFGADMDDADRHALHRAQQTMVELFSITEYPFMNLIERLPLPAVQRFKRARADMDRIVYGLIDRREASPDPARDDLLSRLLRAQDPEAGGATMSREQARDEALTLLLAGHETTANALSWTWLLLSRHPAVLERLQRELDEVLGGRPPQPADEQSLVYTRQVVSESMRLYPPAWILGKIGTEDLEVAGYQLPARSMVVMSQWITHRDPRWFPDPLKFEPARWSAERRANLPRFAYFPFGGGHRICIGEGFAWTELVLVLAAMAQHWAFDLSPTARIHMRAGITLRPAHGMPMIAHRRH